MLSAVATIVAAESKHPYPGPCCRRQQAAPETPFLPPPPQV